MDNFSIIRYEEPLERGEDPRDRVEVSKPASHYNINHTPSSPQHHPSP